MSNLCNCLNGEIVSIIKNIIFVEGYSNTFYFTNKIFSSSISINANYDTEDKTFKIRSGVKIETK
jgi:hypothetical protein